MTNHEIADQFELLSKLMDIHGEDSFKAKSYASASFKIEKFATPVADLSLEELKELPGIGTSLSLKIDELNRSGTLSLLQEYIAKTPPGVIAMLAIKGIGPKKIGVLWKELGLESIGELEYACQENRLVTVKGFGVKTQQAILQNIEFIKSNSGLCLFAEAEMQIAALLSYYNETFPDELLHVSGDFRRQQNVLSQIDFVTTLSKENILSAFGNIPYEILSDSVSELRVKTEPLPPYHYTIAKDNTELHLQWFRQSSSAAFIEAFEKQYSYPQLISTETEIFTANQLPFIHPALREDCDILKTAAQDALPQLIMPADIKGIIHSHSTYSDGQHSLEQMAVAAKEKGYEYLVISDHSQAAFYANGLQPERIKQQHAEIEQLNIALAPFKIFKSIEADILNDGNLDYNAAILSTFDLVIGSVHSNLKMTEEKAMQRLLTAIQNPALRILGHPTGRLLLSRAGYPIDHKTIIDACAEHNVVIEINAHPRRLDLDWSWISYALEKGVLLSIDPDAHSISGMDMVKYGVLAAQKGGLTSKHNLSSFSLEAFENFLASK